MDASASVLNEFNGPSVLHAFGALAVDLQDFIADPHFPIPNCSSFFSKPQHVQVHVVLSSSPQAEAEAFVVSFQVHRVELRVLIRFWLDRLLERRVLRGIKLI